MPLSWNDKIDEDDAEVEPEDPADTLSVSDMVRSRIWLCSLLFIVEPSSGRAIPPLMEV
jgi:hypothetical protein